MRRTALFLACTLTAAAGCDLIAGLDNPSPASTGTGGTGTTASGGSNTTGGTNTAGTGGTTGTTGTEAVCGNKQMEAGEECDDGNTKDADGCEANCTLPKCGNGIVDPGELCFGKHQEFSTLGIAADMVLVDCDSDGDLDAVVSNSFVQANQVPLVSLRNDSKGDFGEAVITKANFFAYDMAGMTVLQPAPGSFEIVGISSDIGRTMYYQPDPVAPCDFVEVFGCKEIDSKGPGKDLVAIHANNNESPDILKVFADSGGFEGRMMINMDHTNACQPPFLYADTSSPSGIAGGDLLGDTGDDIVLTAADTNSLYLFENVAGLFDQNKVTQVKGLGNQPVDVATGDLDSDGDLDIVTANIGSGTISVLRNLGAGTFAAQVPEPSVAEKNGVAAAKPRSIALGDMNNDGMLDAVTANSDDSAGTSSVSVFLNDGNGKLLLATKATFPLVGASTPFEVGRQPMGVKVGDVNGDGVLDIATVNAYVVNDMSNISILLSNP